MMNKHNHDFDHFWPQVLASYTWNSKHISIQSIHISVKCSFQADIVLNTFA